MKLCPACGAALDEGYDVCSPICAENIKKLRADPAFFAEKICKRILYPKQVEFIRAIFEKKEVAGLFSRQCVPADTKVTMAGDEPERPISEIVPGDRILSINKDGELKADIVANVWCAGVQDVCEIKTEMGNVRATKEHKFLTDKGWYKMRGLKPGMKLAMPAYKTLSRKFERVNDVIYVPIITKEALKPITGICVWDLETETLHNYIANHFISHNSGKTEVISIAALFAAVQLNLSVGIFAPKLEQATRISFKRIREFINNSYWLKNYVKEERATYITFIGGGSIMALSASDQSHIEGHTFQIILVEECQGVSNYMMYDVILPMGSHTDATIVKIGISKGRNHFFDSIHNGQYYVVKSTWKDCPNKGYQAYVKKKKLEMPPESFGSQYELKWNMTEGQYWDPEWLEKAKKLGVDHQLELIYGESQMTKDWIFGIGVDPAKKQDKTIFYVMAYVPNYDLYYPCFLMSMSGRDYTDQVGAIRSIIWKQFPSARNRVCIDTQATEAPVDMLKNSDTMRVLAKAMPFAGPSKEKYYDNFTAALINSKFAFPIDRSSEVKECLEQCYNLEVSYTSQGHKMIHHPQGKWDDYCDAQVLAFEAIHAGVGDVCFADEGTMSDEGVYKDKVEPKKTEVKKDKNEDDWEPDFIIV